MFFICETLEQERNKLSTFLRIFYIEMEVQKIQNISKWNVLIAKELLGVIEACLRKIMHTKEVCLPNVYR